MLSYIVFMIDTNNEHYIHKNLAIDIHDGMIFKDLKEAKKYALDSINSGLCSKFIVGAFLNNVNSSQIFIDKIETFGFRTDKKNPNQLNLFK